MKNITFFVILLLFLIKFIAAKISMQVYSILIRDGLAGLSLTTSKKIPERKDPF